MPKQARSLLFSSAQFDIAFENLDYFGLLMH